MHLIVNPAAAGGRVGKHWASIKARLAKIGFCPTFSLTRAPGHAGDLAADAVAQGHNTVAVAGGDGTICEALQGLRGTATALAILPLGTGNDAARTLGLPLRLEDACRVAMGKTRRRVDLIQAGDRVVLNAIGIGLLGAINVNAQSVKFVRGITAYLVAAVGTLFRYRCPVIELHHDSGRLDGPMTILAIHNGVTTGGGFRLAPHAVPDDGELDATFVTYTSVPTRLSALGHAIRGTLGSKAFTRELRFRRLELRTEERLPYHWDGNPAHIEPPGMTFTVLPAAQEIVAPAP